MTLDDDFARAIQNIVRNPERLMREAQPLVDNVRRFPQPLVGESAAVSLLAPKTAALFFDRVWGGMHLGMPSSVAFWGRTDAEIATLIALALGLSAGPLEEDMRRYDVPTPPIADAETELVLSDTARILSEAVSREYPIHVIPVYTSTADRDAAYGAGDRTALIAAVENLDVVSERELSWEQVLEIRNDREALLKLRRLRHWLDREMIGKPRAYVEDELALRLNDYEMAVRKHGLVMAVGTLATTLDSKVLIGGPAAIAALSYAGAPEWSLVAGTSLIIGKVAVHFAEKMLDYQEVKERSDVCFLAQLRKK